MPMSGSWTDPKWGRSRMMSFLSGNMDRIVIAGTPPGVDPASYYANVVATGQQFDTAATALEIGDVITAAAAYTVARQHLPEILDPIGAALVSPTPCQPGHSCEVVGPAFRIVRAVGVGARFVRLGSIRKRAAEIHRALHCAPFPAVGPQPAN